jgi:hypothetical protein
MAGSERKVAPEYPSVPFVHAADLGENSQSEHDPGAMETS